MDQRPISFRSTGLVTSVGLSAPASCAAIRAKLTQPSALHVADSRGDRITAHEVQIDSASRGLDRLAHLLAHAIEECLIDEPRENWGAIPLLLCVAEVQRPGRTDGLDERLLLDLQRRLNACFAADSAVIPRGRVGVAVALARAQRLIRERGHRQVLIAAVDSLLGWATLNHYDRDERLLASSNSNGFMPGEAAGALLVAAASEPAQMQCLGVGFGMEAAHIGSGLPFRGDGLTAAIKEALLQAGCEMRQLDYRVTDLSGEQYYFKEASLALLRTLRQRKESFDLWHPAECIGEVGAAAGIVMLAVATCASQKGYAPGSNVLAHWANDAGQRAAAVLHWPGQS